MTVLLTQIRPKYSDVFDVLKVLRHPHNPAWRTLFDFLNLCCSYTKLKQNVDAV